MPVRTVHAGALAVRGWLTGGLDFRTAEDQSVGMNPWMFVGGLLLFALVLGGIGQLRRRWRTLWWSKGERRRLGEGRNRSADYLKPSHDILRYDRTHGGDGGP